MKYSTALSIFISITSINALPFQNLALRPHLLRRDEYSNTTFTIAPTDVTSSTPIDVASSDFAPSSSIADISTYADSTGATSLAAEETSAVTPYVPSTISTMVSAIPTTDDTGSTYTIYSTIFVTVSDPATSAAVTTDPATDPAVTTEAASSALVTPATTSAATTSAPVVVSDSIITSDSTIESGSVDLTTTYTSTQFFYITLSSESTTPTASLADDLKNVNLENNSSAAPSSAPLTVTVTVTESVCPSTTLDPTTTYVITQLVTYTMPFTANVSITDLSGSLLTVVPTSTDLTTTYYAYETITTRINLSSSSYSSVTLSPRSTGFVFSNTTTSLGVSYVPATTVIETAAVTTSSEAGMAKRWFNMF